MMAGRLYGLLILAALPVAAAGGSARSDVDPDGRSASGPDQVIDSLAVELVVPDSVLAGVPVPITIRLRNTSEAPIDLRLMGREIVFNVVVTDSSGTVVWERLEGEHVMGILRLDTLGPGAVIELGAEWEQRASDDAPVPPGSYTVQGSVPTDQPEPLRTRAAVLRITAPGG